MKKFDRKTSFIVLSLIYLFAIAVGVLVYWVLQDLAFYWALLVADVVATVTVFVFSTLLKNASVYDPYWSVKPIVVVIAFSIGKSLNLFQILMVLVVCLWGIRLTLNWAYTFHGLDHEDWRYVQIRDNTGAIYPMVNFTGIHLVPTIVTYSVVLPSVFALAFNGEVSIWCYLCLMLSTFAFTMQAIADVEMHRYRKNRTTRFIRTGLWKYSRHPNYLGEILMWWGIGLSVCLYIPNAWYLIIGAVLNTLLFLCISIPLADKRQSKKEGFIEYKRQTRMLLPIPRFKR